jgi:hypothetical protein
MKSIFFDLFSGNVELIVDLFMEDHECDSHNRKESIEGKQLGQVKGRVVVRQLEILVSSHLPICQGHLLLILLGCGLFPFIEPASFQLDVLPDEL